MRVTTTSSFDYYDPLRERHEALSLHGRSNMVDLLYTKVKCGQLPEHIADDKVRLSEMLFPPGSTTKYTDGSTYVPAEDAYDIQISLNLDSKFGDYIDIRDANGDLKSVHKNWLPSINFLQREDSIGHGMPFYSIPCLRNNDRLPAMTTWALLAMTSNVKELYCAIDKKLEPWDVSNPRVTCWLF